LLSIHIHKCGGKFEGLDPQAPDERRLCQSSGKREIIPQKFVFNKHWCVCSHCCL